MDDLCASCLCSGRKLHLIGDTDVYQLYAQILNEIPVYSLSQFTIRICWECKARLHRFDRFKAQVKRSYSELLLYVQQNCTRPVQTPHLGIHTLQSLSIPLIKEEVKEEQDLDHNELETFVNDLPEDVREGRGGREKKECKAKPKKKTKIKKIKKMKVKYKKAELNVLPSDTELDCEDAVDHHEDVNEDVMNGDDKETGGRNDERVKDEIQDVKKVSEATVCPPMKALPERPQCVECGKMFSSKKTFRYHWNVLHKGQNKYPCPRCGKVYQWKSNLGRHMRSHKAVDLDELYCASCDKRFASIATYKQHLRISRRHVTESEFTFMCNECGKKFVNKTGLRDHIDWEHLNKIKFRCQLCTKPFKCRPSLYIHMQNVHRDKEKKDNLCHVCGKSYQNSAKLKYHIVAMHTGATPYGCGQCGAAFGWYSSLYRHVREVHHKIKLQHKKSKKLKKDLQVPPLTPAVQYLPNHQQHS